MELKQLYMRNLCPVTMVLIVPYGIETCQDDEKPQRTEVLIVPYGIETASRRSR